MAPKGNFNGGPDGCQSAKTELQKGSWTGIGPKLPFPGISGRIFLLFNSGPESSKKVSGPRIAVSYCFQAFPEGTFNRDLENCQKCQNRSPKGLWHGFDPKRPFPMISKRKLLIGAWRAAKMPQSSFKRAPLARNWLKTTLSNDFLQGVWFE